MNERTPLRKKSSFRIVAYDLAAERDNKKVANPPQPQPQPQPQSVVVAHDVPQQQMHELSLINSLRIVQHAQQVVTRRINDALGKELGAVVVLAFTIVDGVFGEVVDTDVFETSSTVRMQRAVAITTDQMCLEIMAHPQHHKFVASVLLHLQRECESPLHTIISKQRLRTETGPWWQRLFNQERDGHYYKLVVDFTQTRPSHEVQWEK